jgi:cell division protein FtsL
MTAPRFVGSPQPAPRPAPAQAPAPARRLEVVPDPRVLRTRRLSRLGTAIAGLAACFGLFGVVGVHVMLAQGQADVQRLQARVQQEEDRQQRLRMDVAVLEAPTRVVTTAENDLGMVSPQTVVSLAPTTLAETPPTTLPPRP